FEDLASSRFAPPGAGGALGVQVASSLSWRDLAVAYVGTPSNRGLAEVRCGRERVERFRGEFVGRLVAIVARPRPAPRGGGGGRPRPDLAGFRRRRVVRTDLGFLGGRHPFGRG